MSKRQPDAAQRQRISTFTELLRQKLPLQPGFAALQELRPGQLERSRSYREVGVAAWLANLNAGLAETSLEHWTDWYLFPLERGLDPEADKDEKRDVLLTEGARVLGDVIELLDENPRIADVSSGAAKAGLPPPPGT